MSQATMANAMLRCDFLSSHQDVGGISNESDSTGSGNVKVQGNDPSSSFKNPNASPTKQKSVDFATLPPTKRVRLDTLRLTARQVVEAVSSSISQQERLDAIDKAKETFSHNTQAVHDDEIAAGADAALTKHLTFLLWHAKNAARTTSAPPTPSAAAAAPSETDESTFMMELSTTCEAFESVFQASSLSVGGSFRRMGNEILRLLVTIMEEEIDRRLQDAHDFAEAAEKKAAVTEKDQQDGRHETHEKGCTVSDEQADEGHEKSGKEDSDENVAAVDNDQDHDEDDTKFSETIAHPVHTKARCEKRGRSITPPMCDMDPVIGTPEGDLVLRKVSRILGHFARVGEATKPMAHFPGLLGCLVSLVTQRPYDSVPWEARLSCLWTIANLGCNPENMQMMVCFPGLIDSLIEVACRPLKPGDSLEKTMELLRSRSIASRGILNLSWAPENKNILSEHASLIDLLAELTVHRHAPLSRSRTVMEILVTTRRYAVGALRNLAAATRCIKIGLCDYKNGHLLDILTDAALNDGDAVVKDRAFAAIHNLAIHDTAEKIVNHPALVLALKDALLSEQESHPSDESPRSHAAATLTVLERSITPDMSSYENLRDLLDAITPNPATSDDDNESDDMQPSNTTAV